MEIIYLWVQGVHMGSGDSVVEVVWKIEVL